MSAVAVPLLRLATAAMGTRFELVLPGESPALAAAGEAALHEIERCHAQLTKFSSDSLLSHINRTAYTNPVRLDRATFELFEAALAVARASSGAFDCTLGTGRELVALRAADRTIRFTDMRVSIDLGGMAKGHALDCAARVLRDSGVTCALLHGGTSSVLALGAPPGERGWQIALAHDPHGRIIALRDAALSVSGSLGDRVNNAGHVLDPRTGRAITGERYTAVVGPSAGLADAWSTALLVLGHRPTALGSEWTVHWW